MTSRHSRILCCSIVALLSVLMLATQSDGREFTASSKGSVFLIPNIELRWDDQDNLVQDTFVHLHNDYPGTTRVYCFFVNGDPALPANGNERAHPGWNRVDFEIEMTANQPLYWSMSTGMGAPSPAIPPFFILDPGNPPGRPDPEGTTDRVMRGFLVGWAVNVDSEEIRWNHLAATATVVDYRVGGAWGYNGYHAQSVDPNVLQGDQTGTPGVLNLDGVEFSQPYDRLLFNFPAVGSSLYSEAATNVVANSDVTLMPVSNDLQQETVGPILTDAQYIVYNENEVQLTGMHRCVSCWDQTLMQLYGGPNHFLLVNLQTDAGWAEVDGKSSLLCQGLPGVLTDASLIGVVSREIKFTAGSDIDYSGYNMLGRGGETARIFYDVPDGPPERSIDDSKQPVDPEKAEAYRHAKLAALTNNMPGDQRSAQSSRGFDSFSRFSSSRPGNLVFISKVDVRWDLQGNVLQDTFIHLTNWFSDAVKVQMYFVNGDDPIVNDPGGERDHPGWNHLNILLDLTPNQPVYWSALRGDAALGIPSWADLDPGPPPGRPSTDFGGQRMLRGFIVAWAVDEECREIAGNVLMADANVVSYLFTGSWGYTGYHLPNIANVPFGEPSSNPGTLELGGTGEFPGAFDRLTFISPAANSSAYDVGQHVAFNTPDVTLHQVTADFTPNSPGPVTSKASYEVWNQNEFKLTGMEKCITCWDQGFLIQYPAPQHFDVLFLGTDVGAARIDGIASIVCNNPSSTNAAMLGVLANLITIDAFNDTGFGWFGHNMFGQGLEDAQIDGEACAPCPWDIADSIGPGMDGQVNVFDLLLLLANWNTNGPGAAIAPDVNIVNVFDLLELLANWGPCP